MRRNKIIGLSTEITVLIKVTQKSVVKSNFMESCRNLIVQLPQLTTVYLHCTKSINNHLKLSLPSITTILASGFFFCFTIKLPSFKS